MKKKSIYVGMLIAMTMLVGCGKQENENADIFETVSNESAVTETTSEAETAPEAETEPEADTAKETEEASSEAEKSGMKDGDRFDDVIILEGMEETVHYEHVINDQ